MQFNISFFFIFTVLLVWFMYSRPYTSWTFKFLSFIFVVLLLLICLWFTFAVLQVSCENKSTTIRTTQFMVHTEEASVLYLYTKYEADSSIRSKTKRGPKNLEIRSRDPRHAHLGSFYGPYRKAPSSVPVPNLKQIALFVQKLLGVPKFRNWVTWP